MTQNRETPPAAFAEVVLDRPRAAGDGNDDRAGLVLSYRIPLGLPVGPGHLALVPLGGRVVAGLVLATTAQPPPAVERVLELLRLVDPEPVLTADQLALGRWIADYYCCSLYAALAPMLPPGLSSQEVVTLHLTEAGRALAGAELARLTPRQRRLILALQAAGGVLTGHAARARLGEGDPGPVVRQLVRRALLDRRTALVRPRVAPRQEWFVRLADGRQSSVVSRQSDDDLSPHPSPKERGEPDGDRTSDPSPTKGGELDGDLSPNPSPKERGEPDDDETQNSELRTQNSELRTPRLGLLQRAALDWLGALALPAADEDAAAVAGWRAARRLYRAVPGSTRHTLATLAGHGLVELEQRDVWRNPLAQRPPPPYDALALTPRQGHVWTALAGALEARRRRTPGTAPACFLLHGVTGSGKTEVYLRTIGLALRLGMGAIVLVPEIALTPQTMHRFAGRFPGRVALLHSRLSDGERYDQWRQIRAGRYDVVVGSRSAVFAPLPRLGLIILDEEHEWSYKQDSRPYYHTRDVALRRAALTGAVVVLGSATPDVTTYYRATRPAATTDAVGGVDWQLLTLPARVGLGRGPDGSEMTTELPLPPVRLVDMRQELRGGNRSIFSLALQKAIGDTIRAGEQAILFLNRRGSRTFIICRACGYVPSCAACEIPLVYHADVDRLLCHRCDARHSQPDPCPRCHSPSIKRFGAGTQRVEEEMRDLFPAARVLRWDRDTAARKGAHDDLLGAFMRHEADVLVGTQMIAKGLDVPLVTLVGVISADTGLHLPDFRAGERTFQLLTQVAGRAGRRTAGGQVIVQTYTPEHYAIQAAARHDYRAFYTQDLRFRLSHNYPPFSRLAKLVYSATSEAACQIEAQRLAGDLHALAGRLELDDVEILGPAPSFVHKLRHRYRWQLLLRAPNLAPLLRRLTLPPDWTLDVDPVSML